MSTHHRPKLNNNRTARTNPRTEKYVEVVVARLPGPYVNDFVSWIQFGLIGVGPISALTYGEPHLWIIEIRIDLQM
jgi:hypothetical protein